MFLYCISPHKKLKCNFIKIGICENINLLKNRYSTYYGDSCRYHYVKVNDKSSETKIHKKLKELELHLENELFIYNRNYDFYFYSQMLNNFEINDNYNYDKSLVYTKKLNLYNHKKQHILDFIINIFEKMDTQRTFNNKWLNNSYKYYKKEELNVYYYGKKDIENIWLYYLSFCINSIQYFRTKNTLKNYIQSMIYDDNPVTYKNYNIEITSRNIICSTDYEINFKDFVFEECKITKNDKDMKLLEKYVNEKSNLEKEEIKKYINLYNKYNYMQKNNFPDIKEQQLYNLSYVYLVNDNYSISLKNRLIYYNGKDEKKNFEKIQICLNIIKECGFNGINDKNSIKINKISLFEYIVSVEKKILQLFDIKPIYSPTVLIGHINCILRETILTNIVIFNKNNKKNNELYYINKYEFLDNNLINKIKQEENYINSN